MPIRFRADLVRRVLATTSVLWLLPTPQTWGQWSSSFLRQAPTPLVQAEPVQEPEAAQAPFYGGRPEFPTALNVSTNYSARAALSFDSARLADFSMGTFMPAAIPVTGEPFYDFGHRALLQGNGSAIQIVAEPEIATGQIRGEAMFIVEDFSTAGTFGVSSRAHIQYNRLVVGSTETAFADPQATVPTLDLAGPNGIVTILNPTGGDGQGRLSYYVYPSGSPDGPLIGNFSLEMPSPEIRFTSGMTPATTFSSYSRVPDFVTTWRYSAGEYIGDRKYNELQHLQVGGVFRELALQNADRSIDDRAFGWGVSVSGATPLLYRPGCRFQDGIGFSLTVGEGIGHYVHDLHVLATGRSDVGNDAVLSGTALEVLPAQAYYAGYVHHWNDSWQSSIAYSHVDLDPVPGQVGSAYRRGNYAVVNLVFHQKISPLESEIEHFIAGVEYLYGERETLDGRTGDAHRFMFVVNLSK